MLFYLSARPAASSRHRITQRLEFSSGYFLCFINSGVFALAQIELGFDFSLPLFQPLQPRSLVKRLCGFGLNVGHALLGSGQILLFFQKPLLHPVECVFEYTHKTLR